MLKSGSHDFGPLLHFLTSVAVFCLIGVIANYVSSLLMATISQDSLRSLRNQLFARMQKLPVRYFDTHQHGDIMSIYTNDIDALRQAVAVHSYKRLLPAKSIPVLFTPTRHHVYQRVSGCEQSIPMPLPWLGWLWPCLRLVLSSLSWS